MAKGTLVPVLQMWSTQEEEAKARPKRRRAETAAGCGEASGGGGGGGGGGSKKGKEAGGGPIFELALPAPGGDGGNGDGEGGGFVSQLVGMHKQLASLLSARLADANAEGGTPMVANQLSVVREQLAYSKAFLQSAATDEVAAWRSLGGLPPLVPGTYSPVTSPRVHTTPLKPQQQPQPLPQQQPPPQPLPPQPPPPQLPSDATASVTTKVLLTSCDASLTEAQPPPQQPPQQQLPQQQPPPPASGLTVLRPSDEAAASAGSLRGHSSIEATHADGVCASELGELMSGQTIWFFCGHADGALHGRRTLAFAHQQGM